MVWFIVCLLFVCLFSFPVPAVPLYGYGARENDQEYVERREDFNSPLFKPETGFPFGKTLRSSLYVSLLGLDLLGKQPSLKSLGEAPWTRCLGGDSCGPKLLACCYGLFAAGGDFVAISAVAGGGFLWALLKMDLEMGGLPPHARECCWS